MRSRNGSPFRNGSSTRTACLGFVPGIRTKERPWFARLSVAHVLARNDQPCFYFSVALVAIAIDHLLEKGFGKSRIFSNLELVRLLHRTRSTYHGARARGAPCPHDPRTAGKQARTQPALDRRNFCMIPSHEVGLDRGASAVPMADANISSSWSLSSVSLANQAGSGRQLPILVRFAP